MYRDEGRFVHSKKEIKCSSEITVVKTDGSQVILTEKWQSVRISWKLEIGKSSDILTTFDSLDQDVLGNIEMANIQITIRGCMVLPGTKEIFRKLE